MTDIQAFFVFENFISHEGRLTNDTPVVHCGIVREPTRFTGFRVQPIADLPGVAPGGCDSG